MDSNSNPPYAAMALAVTAQDWTALGTDDDPNVAPSSDLKILVDRVTSLLLVRIVAIHAPEGKYQDLSTTTICRTNLMAGHASWPEPITDEIVQELRKYVQTIMSQYNDVPYHNSEHAYHVTISANKLLDLALNLEIHALSKSKPRMFGLRTDALMHLCLLWCTLIHDVEHKGIPNRQLSMENDELAILYNDQSIAENRSLTIGFKELLKKDYENLRQVMFVKDEEYRRFRSCAAQLVLQTDIASPERTQIRKSKWKEAFGEDFQTVEAKIKHELKRRSSHASAGNLPGSRRMSAASILSELQQLPEVLDSLTNTPDTSEIGGEDIIDLDKTLAMPPKDDSSHKNAPPVPGFSRGVSSGSGPGDEALGYDTGAVKTEQFKKFHRRISAAAGHSRKMRLGIKRSIDLSGEFIESFSRRSTLSTTAHLQPLQLDETEEEDEYDDLKVSVMLEQIITAADIAHVLQGWHQMEKFSNRLFLELKRAHKDGRGPNPKPNWFENQIAFLESYNLPLAQRLEDMGLFGPVVGPVFARLVESNRDQWLVDGQKVTDDIIAKGAEMFPVAED